MFEQIEQYGSLFDLTLLASNCSITVQICRSIVVFGVIAIASNLATLLPYYLLFLIENYIYHDLKTTRGS